MQANGRVQAGSNTSFPSALAEVSIVVDPRFEFVNPDDALLYSFEFSPNMTPVPAPGAAWLFATGLGLLGSRLRRR